MPADVYAEVGRLIRAARRAADVTQEELARRLRMNRTSVTNIEAGRQSVQVHTLLQIATVLDVAPADLLPDRRAETIDVRALVERGMREEELGVVERTLRGV